MKEEILNFLRKSDGYISGEEISRSLKISRAGIWKHIHELRREGYEIIAMPHLGYNLASVPDKLFPSEIQANLHTKVFGKKIFHYEEVASTMDIAFNLALNGEPEGTLIISEGQQKGRGRLGRNWVSPKGKGIYFSLILRPKIPLLDASRLTILAGVAVSVAIKKITGLNCFIKWPNDILIEEKKVAGILTELNAETDRIKFIILGIGINVNTKKTLLPKEAMSLKEELDKNISRLELACQVLRDIELLYLLLSKKGFNPIRDEWKHLSSTIGRRIKVVTLKDTVEGEAVDIDNDGALLVRNDSGFISKVISGDVIRVR